MRARWSMAAGVAVLLAGCPSASEAPLDGGRCLVRTDCSDRTVCVAGSCRAAIPCTSSRVCAGLVCDETRGVCVECVTRADCEAGASCNDGVCGEELDGAIGMDDAGMDAWVGQDAWSDDAGTDAAGDDAASSDAGWDTTVDAPVVPPGDANVPDAAIDDGSVTDGGEGACDPMTQPDLFARYVGDVGVGVTAGRFHWLDQGPMGADLDGLPGPTVLAGVANGHDAVVIGDMAVTPGHSAGWNLGQPFVASLVFRVTTPALEAIFGKGATLAGSGAHELLVSTHAGDAAIDVRFSGEMRTVPAALVPTGRFHVLTITYDGGSTVRAFVDGRVAFTVADATTSSLEVLGAYFIGPFSGAIAEMDFFLAASPSAPATHEACIDAYLMSRYGITGT